MTIHVHIHGGDPPQNLSSLIMEIRKMANSLDTLTAQVASNTTVIGSAITLIQGFAAELAAAGTDPAALAALADSLKQSDDALAQAVAANTTSAPEPVTNPGA